jgi:peptidoglycan DL-endopeptidase CwlO
LRSVRTLLRALLVGTVAVAIVAPASIASAAPSTQQQIAQASAELEKIVEQYNKVTEQLHATQAQQATLQAQLAPLQASMDTAYSSVSGLARKAYEGVPMGTGAALLAAGSPDSLVDQLTALDQIGRRQHNEISGYEQAKAKYDNDKKQLDATAATQTTQQQSLAAQKSKIDNDLKHLYDLRTQAYGSATQTSGARYTGTIPAVSGKAGVAVRYAYNAIGKDYGWGMAGPDKYDCSGLTMAAWGAAGVPLPHNAADQWNHVTHIPRGSLAPGDLVFYSSLGHVAIYVGNNQVIHAPQPFEKVQLASVDMMTPYGYGRV